MLLELCFRHPKLLHLSASRCGPTAQENVPSPDLSSLYFSFFFRFCFVLLNLGQSDMILKQQQQQQNNWGVVTTLKGQR